MKNELRLREVQKLLIMGCPFEIKEVTHRALNIEPVKRVRYTVANGVMQIHAWPKYPAISVNGLLLDGDEELAPVVAFHPRALKLMQKRKNFIVIACDEPYYLRGYRMIRRHEKAAGRWSPEDEEIYQAAIKLWKENHEKAVYPNPIADFVRLWRNRLAGWFSLHVERDAGSRGG